MAAAGLAAVALPAADASTPLGPDVRLSAMGPDGNEGFGAAYPPRVAYNPRANEYLVVFAATDNAPPLAPNELEVYAQRVSADGVPVGSRIRVSDMGPDGTAAYAPFDSPGVAYNATADEYLVVWASDDDAGTVVDGDYEIFGQRLSAGGAQTGANDFRISDLGPDGTVGSYGAFDPSVAHDPVNDQYLVVWRGLDDPTSNGPEIFGQRLTAAGVEGGANDFRISDMGPDGDPASGLYFALHPSVAHNPVNDRFLVVWAGVDTTLGPGGDFEVFAQQLDRAGAEIGSNDLRVSDMGPDGDPFYDAFAPSVAHDPRGNQWLVAWQGDDDTAPLVDGEAEIFGQRLSAAGAPIGANDVRISDMGPDGNTAYAAVGAGVAYSPGADRFQVVWSGDDGTAPLVDGEFEVFGQSLDAVGAPAGPNDVRISDMGPDGNAAYGANAPSVAAGAGDRLLVVWRGDDDTGPLVDDEFEIFGRVLGSPPPAAAAPPGPAAAAPRAFGRRTRVTLRLVARRIPARPALRVRVANANDFPVTGRLTGRSRVRPRGPAGRARSVTLTARPFRVGAKAAKVVTLRLPPALTRRLRSTGRLTVRLRATVRDPAGTTRRIAQTVRPRLKAPAR